MLSRLGIPVPLREAKIDYVNNILLFAVSDKEVIRFHVPVDKVIVVQELQPLNHLVRDHQRRLYREFSFAEVESVLQAWPEQVHDHGVVVAFDAKPVNSWNSS